MRPPAQPPTFLLWRGRLAGMRLAAGASVQHPCREHRVWPGSVLGVQRRGAQGAGRLVGRWGTNGSCWYHWVGAKATGRLGGSWRVEGGADLTGRVGNGSQPSWRMTSDPSAQGGEGHGPTKTRQKDTVPFRAPAPWPMLSLQPGHSKPRPASSSPTASSWLALRVRGSFSVFPEHVSIAPSRHRLCSDAHLCVS